MRVLLAPLALLSTLAAGVLVITATYSPAVTSSLNYSYSIAGTNLYLSYSVALALISFALMSDKFRSDLSPRLSLIGVVLIAGCLANAVNLSEEGSLWIARQSAFDAPSWQNTNQEGYWQAYSQLIGQDHRNLYETWGPNVTWNDTPVFSNAIWALSQEQAKELVNAAGQQYRIEPYALYWLSSALALQLLASLLFGLRALRFGK